MYLSELHFLCANCENPANLEPRRESTIPGAQWELVTKWGELIWLDASPDRNRRIKSAKIHDLGSSPLFPLILIFFMFDFIWIIWRLSRQISLQNKLPKIAKKSWFLYFFFLILTFFIMNFILISLFAWRANDTVRRPLKEAFLASKIVILDYFSRELPF